MSSCPRCQTQNPAGAQFCAACGHRFAPGGTQAPMTRISEAAMPPAPPPPGPPGAPSPSHPGGQPASHPGAQPSPSHPGAAPGGPPRTMALEAVGGLAGLGLAGGGSNVPRPTEVTIGRDPGCTISIDNPVVSGRHARIVKSREGLVLEDLGSTNGTYVNGQRVSRQLITFQDDVRVGSAPVPLSDPRVAGLLVHVRRRPPRGEAITLGSAADADIQIEYPNVAPQHAQIIEEGEAFSVRDLGAPAGTFVDGPHFRVREARLQPNSVLLLGHFPFPVPLVRRLLDEAEGGGGALAAAITQALSLDRPVIHIGRTPDNDLVLPHPTVSSRHARLSKLADGSVKVEDFGSTNGTYVDAERVGPQGAIARPGQVVRVGAVALTIGQGGRIAGAARAKVRLDLQRMSLIVSDRSTGKPRPLLDDVSMSIFAGELVGMLGPSGAGKSTLLMTVLGILRPTQGGVLLNGRPLYAQYESFRTNVGYVPQDDIVHPQLTVQEALWYACKLRLPAGTRKEDLQQSIAQTLKQVGLYEQRDLQIGSAEEKVLSGGQRRRVNLAVELVTDPSLLMLDEPTSGLSWTDAADVVATLRRLADDGRTIVLTIHQPDYQEYEKFDNVAILGRGGKLVFYGPPSPDSYEFFGAQPGKPREMFDHVEQMPAQEWRERFHKTQTHHRFVVERGAAAADASQQGPPPKARGRSSFRQFPVLLGRSLKLTMRNTTALALLLLQAPLLGLLIGLTTTGSASFTAGAFGCTDAADRVDYCGDSEPLISCEPTTITDELMGRWRDRQPPPPPPGRYPPGGVMPTMPQPPSDLWSEATDPERRAFHDARVRDPRTGLLAILMALFLPMIIASSNVLVAERTIYERERLAGLNIIPYVLARFLVLAGLGAIVASLNLAVALPLLELRGNPFYYWAVGVMVTSSAAAIGLALSAAVRNPVSALWGINFLVIPQLLFAGSITRLEGVTGVASWFTTTRYALEALVNIDLHARGHLATCQVDRYLENLPGFMPDLHLPIVYAFFGTGWIGTFCLLMTMVLLKLKDKKVG